MLYVYNIFILSLLINTCFGFYVPGMSPVEYVEGDAVEMKAVKMTSSKAQLPYGLYSIPYCLPTEDLQYKVQSLGEVLRGDRTVNTAYHLQMLRNVECQFLCAKGADLSISKSDAETLRSRIVDEYYVQLSVDNLPCATLLNHKSGEQFYESGYRLGYFDGSGIHLNNHLTIRVKYNSDDMEKMRVVGCELEPRSISSNDIERVVDKEELCSFKGSTHPVALSLNSDEQFIKMTYSVIWEKSDLRWASRWDIYLKMRNGQIHWFSILNSLVVILFLSAVLTVIMVRTLRRDIAQYNREDIDEEEAFEERGWKLVHGDVFRPPSKSKLFVTFIGSGIQLLVDAFTTLFFAMLGMLSPASRGALMTAAILCYFFSGLIGGYFSGRLYRTIKGVQWRKAAIQTGLFYPGIIFLLSFFVNFFFWGEASSGAIPFYTAMGLLCMWLGISLPLVLTGYYFGFRKSAYEHPVRTNQIPRQIPPQSWFLRVPMSLLVSGALPFGALFIELYFVLNAIWLKEFYYLFGFLFLVFLIVVVCVGIVSIVMTYFQLCAESWNWWWRSFIHGGGVAVYVFLYCCFYFFNKLDISEFIPTLIFFVYSLMMSFTVFLLCGTIGFYFSYVFVNKIYSAVKID